MDRGALVPDYLMINLVMEDATPYLEDGKSLLLDGFPRNLEQAKALEKLAHIDMVANLDVPTETIVDRIADRWVRGRSRYRHRRQGSMQHILLTIVLFRLLVAFLLRSL
jgi:adenylate kinase family enzyme